MPKNKENVQIAIYHLSSDPNRETPCVFAMTPASPG